MFNIVSHSFKYGNYNINIETGMLAKNCDSSIFINANDTSILITIVEKENKNLFSNNIFFPLTVNYIERFYSYGKIPNNFLKREIKQSENEILISRIIDRSIRPLFNLNYLNELQIIITVFSLDSNVNTDVISIIGVSAALCISNIPFDGPVGSCKIGYINNEFILNPSCIDIKNSKIDMLISGTKKSIIMIELFSEFINENDVIKAINFGKEKYNCIIDNIEIFKEKFIKNNSINYYKKEIKNDNSLYELVYEISFDKLNIAYSIEDKNKRLLDIEKIKVDTINNINNILNEVKNNDILLNINIIEKNIIKNSIFKNKIRIDKRNYDSIRDINIKTGLLKRTHGSSLFTRGGTQSLVSVTLSNDKNNKNILENNEEELDYFLVHYNFLPFSVKEIGNIGFPKRREIGHGKLIKRSLKSILPNFNDFSYYIRIVSEIIESDGSSSMASICGSSLALMDAGVPIKSHIAGIAMGLIKNKNNYIILTDISGLEDNFGDLDMKVSGNLYGITSIQMDTKINEISIDIIINLINKAIFAIKNILFLMNNHISTHNKELSIFAPKIIKLNINKDQIKNIIGKGGSVIKSIIRSTKSNIDIDDFGNIKIYYLDNILGFKTVCKINEIASNFTKGAIFEGTISYILKNGIIVELTDKKNGLINFSTNKNIKYNIKNFNIGKKIFVKIVEILNNSKFKLLLNHINNIDKE